MDVSEDVARLYGSAWAAPADDSSKVYETHNNLYVRRHRDATSQRLTMDLEAAMYGVAPAMFARPGPHFGPTESGDWFSSCHAAPAGFLPAQEWMSGATAKARLRYARALLRASGSLWARFKFVHGDLHQNNVLVRERASGRIRIMFIDLEDAFTSLVPDGYESPLEMRRYRDGELKMIADHLGLRRGYRVRRVNANSRSAM
jgi:hypothetical protein